MITPQELRIGNWIEWDDESHEQIQVEQITCNKDDSGEIQNWFVNGGLIEDFVPIPLTEEWLLKFGFASLGGGLFQKAPDHLPNYVIGISQVPGGTSRCQLYIGREPYGNFTATHIDYAHQLQNLFFALTGQELTPLVRN
jgi:hypothetical protein